MLTFRTINPYDNQVLAEYRIHSRKEVKAKLDHAAETFYFWKKSSFSHRASLLQEVGRLLRERNEEYAQLITAEMGKPIREARAEINKCALLCDYYAINAEKMLQSEPIATEAKKTYVRYDAIGGVFAIMPWNFPFWQVFRFAAPTLMAGNVALLKHAPNSTGVALAIEKVFADAGYPENVFQTLVIDINLVSYVISHPIVQAVTLTGSERAGASVAEAAGLRLKKTVLELGGSDPFIVLENADVQKAIQTAVQSRLLNGGQSCISAKRFFIHQSLFEKFTEALKAEVLKLKVGNPTEDDTNIGPMARLDLAIGLEKQVKRCLEMGASLVLGGERKGNFFEPTILSNISENMPAYREELFGPVFTMIPFESDEEVINMANSSEYGLGATIWSQDIERAENLAAQIDSGCVFINTMVRSDQRVPFGGVKKSGYGRELSSNGIREFVNIKTVWVE